MSLDCWVLVTTEGWGGALTVARAVGRVTAVVVGPRDLADQVAAAGPEEVRWVQPDVGVPEEAYASALAEQVSAAAPRMLIAASDPASRVLIGAAAARIRACLVPGVTSVTADGTTLLVQRSAIGGETIETVATDGPVAAIYAGEDVPVPATAPASPVTVLQLAPVAMTVLASDPIATATGLADAPRVVSFGRGVKARDDVELMRQLADALDAELACSMPVADDLGWLEKERYVGRSGNHITPNLYLAVGIAGAPQHMEGVRGARVIAAINSDPDARVFLTADYGIVGDLYQVVPELIKAVNK
ncbi:MAG TPA: electron transfer flavoprotein subunit alpha/FixB family protein [Propionicimonas sp.]|nr:electron transfer flavoprotein subunit alpha/FixB family protein [Propionicimonas sp.]